MLSLRNVEFKRRFLNFKIVLNCLNLYVSLLALGIGMIFQSENGNPNMQLQVLVNSLSSCGHLVLGFPAPLALCTVECFQIKIALGHI